MLTWAMGWLRYLLVRGVVGVGRNIDMVKLACLGVWVGFGCMQDWLCN
jgi:hypothetical protein